MSLRDQYRGTPESAVPPDAWARIKSNSLQFGLFTDGTAFAMDPEMKAKWVAALRDTNNKQAHATLIKLLDYNKPPSDDNMSYCCLGLFSKVAGCQIIFDQLYEGEEATEDGSAVPLPEWIEEAKVCADGHGNINDSDLLQQDYANQYGITPWAQTVLSKLNDGSTFDYRSGSHAQIAFLTAVLGEPEMVLDDTDVMRARWQICKYTFPQIADVIEKHF